MHIGFLTTCLLPRDLDATAQWAGEHGFRSLELHAGPRSKIDWAEVAGGATGAVLEPLRRHGLSVAGLMYGMLPYLDPDPAQREFAAGYLRNLLRAAAQLGTPVVSTFTGRDDRRPIEEALELYTEVFTPLAALAEDLGVKLAFENCPMNNANGHGANGYPAPAGNLAYSPEMWDQLFARIPSPALGLNLDPSHLLWQGIDPVAAARDYASRVWICQAKDAEVLPHVLARTGIAGEGWWRYRLPGFGQVPWSRFLSALAEGGYDGVVSIEHEDPVWEGTPEKVEHGLLLARTHLEQFV